MRSALIKMLQANCPVNKYKSIYFSCWWKDERHISVINIVRMRLSVYIYLWKRKCVRIWGLKKENGQCNSVHILKKIENALRIIRELLLKCLETKISSMCFYISFERAKSQNKLHSRLGLQNTPTAPLCHIPYLDRTLNNLMVRFQWCWGFGECRALLHCHCSLVHSGPEW